MSAFGKYDLVSYQADKEIIYERNASYWGPGLHFDRIHWDLQTKDPVAETYRLEKWFSTFL